jgi:hypothetical protein
MTGERNGGSSVERLDIFAIIFRIYSCKNSLNELQ